MRDLLQGIMFFRLWTYQAWHDTRQRYRRTLLGPLWHSLVTAAMVAMVGLVFHQVFNRPAPEFLLYVAPGIVMWNAIAATLGRGANALIEHAYAIKNLPLPLSVYILKGLTYEIITFLHNVVVVLVVYLLFSHGISASILLVIPALLLVWLNLAWMAFLLAVVSIRFRDVPMIVTASLSALFIVTPVFWSTDLLPTRPVFVSYNPFYHFLELVRVPLMGGVPSAEHWLATLLSVVVGWSVTLMVFSKCRPKIVFWT